MSKFEGGRYFRRQLREKRLEERQILFGVRRELKQQRSEFVVERASDTAERLDQLSAIFQSAVVRDPARRFERQLVRRRRLRGPSADQHLVRHTVERVVDFDGGKPRGIVRQHSGGRQG